VRYVSGVGPALVDRICRIDRYPERGGQAIVTESIKQAGGAAANTIFGLASFGEHCRFYTTLGKDANADFFKSSLERVGVQVNYWITHPETGEVDIYVDCDGERTFFVHPNASGKLKLHLKENDYTDTKLFYLDPFPSNSSFDVHVEIAKEAKSRGCTVALNLSYPYASLSFDRLSKLLRYVDIVILSEFELSVTGADPEDFLDYVSVLVVTLGERGSTAYFNGEKVFSPAFKVDRVVDTTGAGDSFAAGFLKAMLSGWSVEKCLRAGNFVASYNIQHYGARNFPEWSDVVSCCESTQR